MAVEHCARDVQAVGYSDTSNQVANDRGDPVVASAKCKLAEDKGPRPEVLILVAKQDGEATKPDAAQVHTEAVRQVDQTEEAATRVVVVRWGRLGHSEWSTITNHRSKETKLCPQEQRLPASRKMVATRRSIFTLTATKTTPAESSKNITHRSSRRECWS